MMPGLAHDDRSQGAFGRYRCAQDVRGSTTPTWQGGPLRAPVASPRLVASGDVIETSRRFIPANGVPFDHASAMRHAVSSRASRCRCFGQFGDLRFFVSIGERDRRTYLQLKLIDVPYLFVRA